MHPQHFDRIARALAARSRRQVLAGLAGTAFAAAAPGRAGAACNPQSCDATFDCGERSCGPVSCETTFFEAGTECRAAVDECDLAEVCTGASLACPADRKRPNGSACSDDGNACTQDFCQNGACVHPAEPDGAACRSGACCDGQCVDTRTDEAHCGGCSRACAADTNCCGGACIDLTRNRQHCGRCGRRCQGSCRNGRCKRRKKKR
jgi:hypothetical protein